MARERPHLITDSPSYITSLASVGTSPTQFPVTDANNKAASEVVLRNEGANDLDVSTDGGASYPLVLKAVPATGPVDSVKLKGPFRFLTIKAAAGTTKPVAVCDSSWYR